MTILSRLRSLYRNLTGRPQVEAELDAELQAYLQLLIDEKTRAGMSPDAARRDALVEIGGVEQVKENIRDVRSGLGSTRCGRMFVSVSARSSRRRC